LQLLVYYNKHVADEAWTRWHAVICGGCNGCSTGGNSDTLTAHSGGQGGAGFKRRRRQVSSKRALGFVGAIAAGPKCLRGSAAAGASSPYSQGDGVLSLQEAASQLQRAERRVEIALLQQRIVDLEQGRATGMQREQPAATFAFVPPFVASAPAPAFVPPPVAPAPVSAAASAEEAVRKALVFVPGLAPEQQQEIYVTALTSAYKAGLF
jgi:hypothetical protein